MILSERHVLKLLSQSLSTTAIALSVISLSAFIGCDHSQDSTVNGRVTMDGKILDGGSIVFTNAGNSVGSHASGSIQSDGTYLVQIGLSGEMVAGEYAVSVTSRAPSIPSPEGGPPTPGELLTPKKYASTSTSGLRYQVREGKNIIDIALASEPSASESPAEESADTAEAEEPVEEAAPAEPSGASATDADERETTENAS